MALLRHQDLSRNNAKRDAQSLQYDLNTLEEWSDEWLLRFHPDKCHILTLDKFVNIMYAERYNICNKVR